MGDPITCGMRIPYSQIYRAFPELDPFTDAECRRYVAEARRLHRWSGAVRWVVCAGVWLAAPLAGAALGLGLNRVFAVGDQARHDALALGLWILSLATVLCGVGGVTVLWRDRWLRRIVRERIRGTVCAGCRYSLLGLQTRESENELVRVVACPECGREARVRREDVSEKGLVMALGGPEGQMAR